MKTIQHTCHMLPVKHVMTIPTWHRHVVGVTCGEPPHGYVKHMPMMCEPLWDIITEPTHSGKPDVHLHMTSL